MTVAGNSALYRIDLPSGTAAAIGAVGTGSAPIEGLIVWNRLADALFRDGFE